jgi:hypothetical protein
MKKLLLPICSLVSLSSFGQKHSISINYKPSISYFGKQKQGFDNSYFDSRNGKSTFHNTIDILYNYQLTSKFSLSTGFQYSEQGQNIGLKSSLVGDRIFTTELNYVRIPLTLSYDFISSSKHKLSFYSGLNVGFVTKRNDNYQNVILEDILLPPAEKRYKSNDWAIPFGIIFQKNISKAFFANLGAEYLLGLTNSFSELSSSKFGVLSEFDNSKQSRASINIGIGIRLTK